MSVFHLTVAGLIFVIVGLVVIITLQEHDWKVIKMNKTELEKRKTASDAVAREIRKTELYDRISLDRNTKDAGNAK